MIAEKLNRKIELMLYRFLLHALKAGIRHSQFPFENEHKWLGRGRKKTQFLHLFTSIRDL